MANWNNRIRTNVFLLKYNFLRTCTHTLSFSYTSHVKTKAFLKKKRVKIKARVDIYAGNRIQILSAMYA